MAGDSGHFTGGTITFGTTSTALKWREWDWDGASVQEILTSHIGTAGGYHTKKAAGLKDGGKITLTGVYHTEDTTPTIGGANETIDLEWPIQVSGNSTKAKLTFSGYIESYGINAGFETESTFSMTVVVAGAPTLSAEAL